MHFLTEQSERYRLSWKDSEDEGWFPAEHVERHLTVILTSKVAGTRSIMPKQTNKMSVSSIAYHAYPLFSICPFLKSILHIHSFPYDMIDLIFSLAHSLPNRRGLPSLDQVTLVGS